MGLRAFKDSESRDWRVWDVRPLSSPYLERRVRERRNPEPMLRYSGPERRSEEERRVADTTRWMPPIREWLAFDSTEEKRRLTPVPEGWEDLPDRELARLCSEAVPVHRKLSD